MRRFLGYVNVYLYLSSLSEQGRVAGGMALRLLGGAKAAGYP
jgi:hypothetical protein